MEKSDKVSLSFENNGHPLLHTSVSPHIQQQWKSLIFGLFYKLTPFPIVKSKASKIIANLIFWIAFGLLLLRTIKFLGNLQDTTLFSLNWAYTLPFAILSMHSICALINLFSLAKIDFYNEFAKKYTKVVRNEPPKGTPFIAAQIWLGLFMFFFFFAQMFFVYENITNYDHYVTDVPNSSAVYRNSVFGPNDVYHLDTLVILLATFVSSLAVIIYNLVADTVVQTSQSLNEEIKKAGEEGRLQNHEVLSELGNRQLELLELASYGFSHFNALTTFTFLAGFLSHILIAFVTRSFMEEISSLTKISTFAYMFLGLFLIMACVKRTSDFANELAKTSNIILFEPTIFSKGDEKLSLIATNIVFRIEHSHYLPKVFSSFKINEKFYQRAFLMIAFIIEFLNAHKQHVS